MPRWLASILRRLELDRIFTRSSGGFFLRPEESGEPAEEAPGPEPSKALSSRPELPPSLQVRVGAPQVRSKVDAGDEGDETITTSFVAEWRPQPIPPDDWIRLLRSAPFGTRSTSARDLRWNGKELSIERVNASEIEAYAAKMEEWVDYANHEFAQLQATPEATARFDAWKRAADLQSRLRR